MSLQSRRDFAKLALSALPAAALTSLPQGLHAAGKPNSKVNGVQLGLNVPYSFGVGSLMTADETLTRCLELGLSGVELRTQPVEVFMGMPAELLKPRKGAPKDEAKANAEKAREWRKNAPLAKAKEFRDQWNSAGVLIEIVKVDGVFTMSDDELDYAFALAKALGGRAISTEISHTEAELKRVGSFADKHQFMVGYHGHATTKPEHWELAFSLAKYNGANVDLGHFVAGNNTSPAPFIEKYHDRVTHVHLKDRKFNNGPNTPFGEGDTPIKDVLKLIRDNKWPIQGTIEFEYKVPEGSDRMKEIAKAIQYCRDALA
jgi:sugar phosphate isomerase/epimerase